MDCDSMADRTDDMPMGRLVPPFSENKKAPLLHEEMLFQA
jgi:hypothetical protein